MLHTTRQVLRCASQLAAVLEAPNSVSSAHTPAPGGASQPVPAASATLQPAHLHPIAWGIFPGEWVILSRHHTVLFSVQLRLA